MKIKNSFQATVLFRSFYLEGQLQNPAGDLTPQKHMGKQTAEQGTAYLLSKSRSM